MMTATELLKLKSEELKQKGLEKVAISRGFSEDNLILLGRILSLESHPMVKSVKSTVASDGRVNLTSYNLIIEGELSKKNVDKIFDDSEFPEPIFRRFLEKETLFYQFNSGRTDYDIFVVNEGIGYLISP